jgi:hypothetical protein
MFIATKYEEVYPIKLKTVHEKIAHKKLSMEEIRQKEKEILKDLQFCITGCNMYDFLSLALFKLNIAQHLGEVETNFFYRLCIYLAKMTQYYYELLSNFTFRVLAASVIYVSLKIME